MWRFQLISWRCGLFSSFVPSVHSVHELPNNRYNSTEQPGIHPSSALNSPRRCKVSENNISITRKRKTWKCTGIYIYISGLQGDRVFQVYRMTIYSRFTVWQYIICLQGDHIFQVYRVIVFSRFTGWPYIWGLQGDSIFQVYRVIVYSRFTGWPYIRGLQGDSIFQVYRVTVYSMFTGWPYILCLQGDSTVQV